MDKTNYQLLSIVAIVAIVSIVAMFLTSRAQNGVASISDVTANMVVDIPLTGNVIAAPSAPAAPRPSRTIHRFDFNQDGTLDSDDSEVLASVIDRAVFCPRNNQCDVNSDGFVDIADLGAFNTELLKLQAAQPPQAPVAPVAPRTENTLDSSLLFGTSGALQ